MASHVKVHPAGGEDNDAEQGEKPRISESNMLPKRSSTSAFESRTGPGGDPTDVEPGCWLQFLAGPKCFHGAVACSVMFVVLLVVSIAAGNMGAMGFSTEEGGGWDILTDPTVQSFYVHQELMKKKNFFTDEDFRRLSGRAVDDRPPRVGGPAREALEFWAPEAKFSFASVDEAFASAAAAQDFEARSQRDMDEIAALLQEESEGSEGFKGRSLGEGDPEPLFKERAAYGGIGIIVYEATGTGCPSVDCDITSQNLLTKDKLENMQKFEVLFLDSEDYKKTCFLRYPMGDDDSKGQCMPPVSIAQMLFFDSAATTQAHKLMEDGYGDPRFACVCEADPADSCGACENGKPRNTSSGLASGATSAIGCLAGLNGGNTAMAYGILDIFCDMLNTTQPPSEKCGVTPPGTGVCSSPVWNHVTDDKRTIVSEPERTEWYAKLCSGGAAYAYLSNTLLPAGACAEFETKGVAFMRTFIYFGAPSDPGLKFPAALNATADEKYLGDTYGRKFLKDYTRYDQDLQTWTGGEVRALVFTQPSMTFEVEALMMHDAGLASFAFIIVFMYMWFSVESFFLTSIGMVQIFFSFPPAAMVWWFFNSDGIQSLQMLCIFMILGIGADDVFVFVDAWKQAKEAGKASAASGGKVWSSLDIFALAYKRSLSAMAATTFTTCAAFIFGVFSKIGAVRDFCVFATFVVLFDFIWCITLFCAGCAFYEKYMEGNVFCCFPCLRSSPGCCCQPGCCWGSTRIVWRKVTKAPAEASTDNRAMEQFVSGPLFNFINKCKIPLLIFWAVAVLAAIISFATSLRVASQPPTFGDQNNMFVRFATLNGELFSATLEPIEVTVQWGLDVEKPMAAFKEMKAEPKWADGFASSAVTAEGQQKILNMCQAPDTVSGLRCREGTCMVAGAAAAGPCERNQDVWDAHEIYVPNDPLCLTGRYCFMERVKEFADRNVNYSFPVEDFAKVIESDDFLEYTALRNRLYIEKGIHWDVALESQKTGVHLTESKEPGFLFMTFNATFKRTPTLDDAESIFSFWEAFLVTHVPGTGARQFASMYLFMILQQELLAASMQGIATSLAVAFFALCIVTFNWYIALIGFFNITIILVLFLGTMPLLGWELGIFESIFLIMTVGLSVDYTVHLLHSYNHSSAETREERVQESLASMGITVVSGAITTLGAAIPLFLCWLRFFQQYGAFVFFTILISILCAVLLLPPLLLLIGPTGNTGDIYPFFWLYKKITGDKGH